MTQRSATRKFITATSAVALAFAGTVLVATPAASAPFSVDDESKLAQTITDANALPGTDVITISDITVEGASHGVHTHYSNTTITDSTFSDAPVTTNGDGVDIEVRDSRFNDASGSSGFRAEIDHSSTLTIANCAANDNSQDGFRVTAVAGSTAPSTSVRSKFRPPSSSAGASCSASAASSSSSSRGTDTPIGKLEGCPHPLPTHPRSWQWA